MIFGGICDTSNRTESIFRNMSFFLDGVVSSARSFAECAAGGSLASLSPSVARSLTRAAQTRVGLPLGRAREGFFCSFVLIPKNAFFSFSFES